MKCYIQIISLLMIIAVCWFDEVKCKPRRHFRKIVKFENTRLPIKHVSFHLEKVTPFGKYEFKHIINKRQAVLPEVPLIPSKIPVIEGSIDDLTEKKELVSESNSEPQVIITSIVQPVDDVHSLITLTETPQEIVAAPVSEVIVESESTPVLVASNAIEEVVTPGENIIPKPSEILQPPAPPIEPNVLINTVVESSVPPLTRIPVFRNPSLPFISPVLGNVGKPFLYTDITQIPLSVAANPAPVAVPGPEVIVPPQLIPPPPVIKEDPPLIKQETPNFFVKGSRLVLYVGSMMLQMLSRFVNGGFNINQIPLPIIPGMK